MKETHMPELEAREVPADTREITYTGRGGAQVSIPITKKGKTARAHPASLVDVRALDALGFTLARQADDATSDDSTAETEAPTGAQEG
jgi:hypothetical protein